MTCGGISDIVAARAAEITNLVRVKFHDAAQKVKGTLYFCRIRAASCMHGLALPAVSPLN